MLQAGTEIRLTNSQPDILPQCYHLSQEFYVYIYLHRVHSVKCKIYFFWFSFNKCKFCIDWNLIIAKINLISQEYLFWCYSKWRQIKLRAPGLISGLSSIFSRLRNGNQIEFTEKCWMWTEKHVLSPKILSKELNMGLPLQAWVRKTIYWVETHWLFL